MKVLVDGTVLQSPPTGIAKGTMRLYQACLDLEPELRVMWIHRRALAGPLPTGMEDVTWGGLVPSRLLRLWGAPDDAWRSLLLPVAVWAQRPTVIHLPWNGKVPRLLHHVPTVITIHDVLPLEIPRYFRSEEGERQYRARLQRDIDRGDLLITISEYSKKQIADHFRLRSEPAVIRYASTLDPEVSAALPEPLLKGGYWLYVGGYDPRKGLEQMLGVFLALHEQKKVSSPLVLVGTPIYFSESFRRLVDVGRASGALQEWGYVSDATLTSLYTHAKALVYPSRYEGFGLPPLEAMSLGCPVITTACSAIPEICGSAALYVEPDQEQDLAEALMVLEKDAHMRTRLGMLGRQRAASFAWKASARKYLDLVNMLVRQASP